MGLVSPLVCGILVPLPGIKPATLELEGGFLTTGLPGKAPDPDPDEQQQMPKQQEHTRGKHNTEKNIRRYPTSFLLNSRNLQILDWFEKHAGVCQVKEHWTQAFSVIPGS